MRCKESVWITITINSKAKKIYAFVHTIICPFLQFLNLTNSTCRVFPKKSTISKYNVYLHDTPKMHYNFSIVRTQRPSPPMKTAMTRRIGILSSHEVIRRAFGTSNTITAVVNGNDGLAERSRPFNFQRLIVSKSVRPIDPLWWMQAINGSHPVEVLFSLARCCPA